MTHGHRPIVASFVAAALVSFATHAAADYDLFPEIRPEHRCVHPHPVTGELVSFEEAGTGR